ncbi:SMI1/KNR4 family protein [Embleya sp. MST-111070]|uniref:SMI1/KNR4 family protein n=1 Tax=Embleya sp. MST-111070 TaxID=3398231 RepID=UPI003F734479
MTEPDHADDWPDFLARWSAEWADARDSDHLAGDNLAAWRRRWLGFPGADEERLAALETRIGRRLPPSYRSFLALTDGWLNAGNFVMRLSGTAEVAPLSRAEAEEYTEYDGYLWEDDDPTEEMIHRSRMWHRALRIDAEADAGILMLDPGDVGPDGEWAVYSWHSWRAESAKRFESFRAFMQDKYREFHALAAGSGMVNDTTRALDAEVEQAREDVLAGRWEQAAEVFTRAGAFGRPGAGELGRQLCAFLGKFDAWPGAYRLHGGSDEPTEILPACVALEIRRSWRRPHEVINELPEEVRELAQSIADATFVYEPPGPFGAVVSRAREAARWGDTDGAWRVLRDGLAHWTPPTRDIVAPVGLLADPLLAPVITPERGRELLAVPRAGRTGAPPEPGPDLDPEGLDWLAGQTWPFHGGHRFVLVEGVEPARLVDLFGHEEQNGLAASATSDELIERRMASGHLCSADPWDDRAVMVVGRAGSPGWAFAFAPESGAPDADRLRSPAARASRSASGARAVAVWCVPGSRLEPGGPWEPPAFHLSMARDGEIEYALTVTMPPILAATEDGPARTPVVTRAGTLPRAFDPDTMLAEVATAGSEERDRRPGEDHMLRAIADEFGVTLPRHALLRGRLHSFETVSWSREARPGDRWLSIGTGWSTRGLPEGT